MDYLVIEGYKDAAERFSNETGLSPQVDLESIENRMNIRSAIQRGDVDDAIGRVNELDPEVSRRMRDATFAYQIRGGTGPRCNATMMTLLHAPLQDSL